MSANMRPVCAKVSTISNCFENYVLRPDRGEFLLKLDVSCSNDNWHNTKAPSMLFWHPQFFRKSQPIRHVRTGNWLVLPSLLKFACALACKWKQWIPDVTDQSSSYVVFRYELFHELMYSGVVTIRYSSILPKYPCQLKFSGLVGSGENLLRSWLTPDPASITITLYWIVKKSWIFMFTSCHQCVAYMSTKHNGLQRKQFCPYIWCVNPHGRDMKTYYAHCITHFTVIHKHSLHKYQYIFLVLNAL